MTYQDLRQKYLKFVYEKFEYEVVGENLELKFFYAIPPDHKFTHKISIKVPQPVNCATDQLDNLVFNVGLSLMPSYWKLTCSQKIVFRHFPYNFQLAQESFWKKLLIKGMGEFYYRNQIDFTDPDFIKFFIVENQKQSSPKNSQVHTEISSDAILVPVGGGKDSTTTMEILKSHYPVTPLIINSVPLIENVVKTANVNPPIIISSQIDPQFLKLNDSEQYLKGHFPINAFYGFAAVLVAAVNGNKYIAISNERSSQEGNAFYLGSEINHQYSRTLEFETDLQSYIHKYISPEITYFSFLRPLYELQIARLFSKYEQYYQVFSSCNRNFTIDPSQHPKNRWCTKCPKCVSTALLLCPFLGKNKIREIMGNYPPDLPENQKNLDDLLGKNPTKPFECVLTRDEANAAFDAVELGQFDQLNQILSTWMDNPNMPVSFEKILKEAL